MRPWYRRSSHILADWKKSSSARCRVSTDPSGTAGCRSLSSRSTGVGSRRTSARVSKLPLRHGCKCTSARAGSSGCRRMSSTSAGPTSRTFDPVDDKAHRHLARPWARVVRGLTASPTAALVGVSLARCLHRSCVEHRGTTSRMARRQIMSAGGCTAPSTRVRHGGEVVGMAGPGPAMKEARTRGHQ